MIEEMFNAGSEMMTSPPPPYSSPTSLSRSHIPTDRIAGLADAMLHSSISGHPLPTSVSQIAQRDDRRMPPSAYPSNSRSRRSSTSHRRISAVHDTFREQGEGTAKVEQSPDGAFSSRDTSAQNLGDLKHQSTTSLLSGTTTSSTLERLRLAELERDQLRRAIKDQTDIVERLKRESDTVELSALDAHFRIENLRDDLHRASIRSSRPSTRGMFRNAYSTDLLFLIDATSSMLNHIEAAKNQVRSIVADIKASFLDEADVRIAVVGYRDHNDTPNIDFLDFTTNVKSVHSFLDKLDAIGGDDTPEDVLGGIQRALEATWKQQTRCIIHIADAPPHGRTNHNDGASSLFKDNYSEAGTEPHGLTYKPLLTRMIKLNINYALLRINHSTDRMAANFFSEYVAASAVGNLHKSNKFYKSEVLKTGSSSGTLPSRSNGRGRLLFEEAELGTSFSALQHLVLKIVTTSASLTASYLSTPAARLSRAETLRTRTSDLKAIKEKELNVEETQLDRSAPQWQMPSWFEETLILEGFSIDLGTHNSSTLDELMADNDNIKMSITELTVHKRTLPFAHGAMRAAFYARTACSTDNFVIKSFKRRSKKLAHVAEDMMCQALCKAFALEFNAMLGEGDVIDFIIPTCLKGKDKSHGTSRGNCVFIEPFISGTYVKYNSNAGWVNSDSTNDQSNKMAQAFSHFTFERSHGRFLVSDLQGVNLVLTDPAVHTLDRDRFRLSDANFGKDGFKFFFSTHECNDICAKLKLKSDRTMIMTGSYLTNSGLFRNDWPSVAGTVCCANKLCGRIVRLGVFNAQQTPVFPGYYWCNTCYPQLKSSLVKRICVAAGAHHEFIASRFFYESQGRNTPRKCLEHREHSHLQERASRCLNLEHYIMPRKCVDPECFGLSERYPAPIVSESSRYRADNGFYDAPTDSDNSEDSLTVPPSASSRKVSSNSVANGSFWSKLKAARVEGSSLGRRRSKRG